MSIVLLCAAASTASFLEARYVQLTVFEPPSDPVEPVGPVEPVLLVCELSQIGSVLK